MRSVILKCHDGWAFQITFCLKIVLFEENRSVLLLFQINLNLPEKKLQRISKNRIIVTLSCCALQQTWRQFGPGVWCLFVNISGHADSLTVEGKGKKTSRFCVIEREYSNKLYELGCFPIKPTRITKTFIWPTSGP